MPERAPLTLAVAYPTAVARPMTGHVELALGDALSAHLPRPDRVSGVLSAVFAQIGGNKVSDGLLEQLTSGARAWLLAKAALVFLPGKRWFQANCTGCGQIYDLSLSLSDLPRGPKTDAFPVVEVNTSLGLRRFEVPNGRVERRLVDAPPEDALQVLVRETALAQSAEDDSAAFTGHDLEAIETALDEASPDISEEVATICPSCEAETRARLDPLDFAFPSTRALFRDIHDIAKGYGWSEPVILDLPSARRRIYAQMIRAEARR